MKEFFKKIGRTFSYDFVFEKKVIEFYGDYWHCNPQIYDKDYFHKYLQMTAEEIWEDNNLKNECIKQEGYDVLIIWESDYKKDKEATVQKCIEFLSS
jgi:G:T-mismatch repair DNA endonuclease (very short patch repair protein)